MNLILFLLLTSPESIPGILCSDRTTLFSASWMGGGGRGGGGGILVVIIVFSEYMLCVGHCSKPGYLC